MNKKGFVLLETAIVLIVTVIAMLGLYATYAFVFKNLKQAQKYDNINDIYKLNIFYDLKNQTSLDNISGNFVVIDSNNCTTYFDDSYCSTLMNDLGFNYFIYTKTGVDSVLSGNVAGLSNTDINYIKTLEFDYRFLIGVKCSNDDCSGSNYYVNLKVGQKNGDQINGESGSSNSEPEPGLVCQEGDTLNIETGKCEYEATLESYKRCPRAGSYNATTDKCEYTGEVVRVFCLRYVGSGNDCGNGNTGNQYGWCFDNWGQSYCPEGWDYYETYEGAINGRVYSCPEGSLSSDHKTCQYDGRPVYTCPNGGTIVDPNCDNGYTCLSLNYTDGGVGQCFNPWSLNESCACLKNNAVSGSGLACSGGTHSSLACPDEGACVGNDGKCYYYGKTPSFCEERGFVVTGCGCQVGLNSPFIQKCKTSATEVTSCRSNICAYTPQ